MIITCKCGKWYNTTIKCPECGTVADKKYNLKEDNDGR